MLHRRTSPHCEQCLAFDPVWKELANDTDLAQMHVRLGTVDCSAYPSLAARFQVRGYPSLR